MSENKTPSESGASVTSILRASTIVPIVTYPFLRLLREANIIINDNHFDIAKFQKLMLLPLYRKVAFLQTLAIIQSIAILYLFLKK